VIRRVGRKYRLVTISLPASEYSWLEEFLAVLEAAGYGRARSAVVSLALAELRESIGQAPPDEVVELLLRRDAKRLIAAIEGNPSKPAKTNGRQRS